MSSVFFKPDNRTTITGDVVFSETHAFADAYDYFDGWIELVKRVQSLDPSRFIVGHTGPAVRRGDSVLSEQIDWLETYRDHRADDQGIEIIKSVMVSKYPTYSNDFILEFSIGVRRLP